VDILSLEDKTKGSMIEGTDGFVSPIKQSTLDEVVSHALHGCNFDVKQDIPLDSDIHSVVSE
jgi:hypothetical protein